MKKSRSKGEPPSELIDARIDELGVFNSSLDGNARRAIG